VYSPVSCPWLVAFDGSFRLAERSTAPPPGAPDKETLKEQRARRTDALRILQRRLYAENLHSILLVFQAMDAAGKDGTIRAVMTGVDPSGCVVHPFGPPSTEERAHDFLWRAAMRLPRKGRIGIFNRSWYEEVLVVRVRPDLLGPQRLPRDLPLDHLWAERFESIVDFEKHLARSGTAVVKFFLHVGRKEQRRRLLKRIDDPARNWKFDASDLAARAQWPAYMEAYDQALRETSRPWAPWYVIPADDKHFMRLQVADIAVRTIESLAPRYPVLPDADLAGLQEFREALTSEDRADPAP
jgi:PPK2 family polyphosphate:nucleotide phosphotransferase